MSAPFTSFKPRKTRLRRGRLKAKPYHSIETRAGMKQALHDLTSWIVRLRDKRCVTRNEDCAGELTCSHFYKRDYTIIAFDFTNCNAQCETHNYAHNYNPHLYLAYMLDRYDEETVHRLHELRMNRKLRVSDAELKLKLVQYRTIHRLMVKGWSFEAACAVAGLTTTQEAA